MVTLQLHKRHMTGHMIGHMIDWNHAGQHREPGNDRNEGKINEILLMQD